MGGTKNKTHQGDRVRETGASGLSYPITSSLPGPPRRLFVSNLTLFCQISMAPRRTFDLLQSLLFLTLLCILLGGLASGRNHYMVPISAAGVPLLFGVATGYFLGWKQYWWFGAFWGLMVSLFLLSIVTYCVAIIK